MDENVVLSAHRISNYTKKLLLDWFSVDSAEVINMIFLLFLLVTVAFLIQYLARKAIRMGLNKIAFISNISFLKHLVNNKFPHYLALLLPYTLVRHSIPVVFADFPVCIRPGIAVTDVYLVFLTISIIMSLIKSGTDVLKEKPAFSHKPMTSYLQVIRLTLSLFGIVIAFSILTGKSPTVFFAAMGAASAVLMLMFKDSIMGFVASIQVTTNDIVRLGDWVTVPKYGADGDVIEINLTTVKVQNFDKTITTLPTYSLISDSFQNWRGMQASGGRRIKRSIIIKQSSIRYIPEEEIPLFKRIQGITRYIEERQAEIQDHNRKIGADRSIPVNGRNLTNAGLFRKYAEWYLQNHPGTHKDMTLMVRQLAPTENGLPFELYVFTNTTQWVAYEYIMADIFDHLIAAVPYFDLQIFERESSKDVRPPASVSSGKAVSD